MKKILTLLLVAVLAISALAFTACGKDSVVGTYKFYSFTIDGKEYKVGDKLYETVEFTEDYMTLELKDDNTCYMAQKSLADGTKEEKNGTWEEKDGNYFITFDNIPMLVTIDGDTVSIGGEGNIVVLKK